MQGFSSQNLEEGFVTDHDANSAQFIHIDSRLNSFIASNMSFWIAY